MHNIVLNPLFKFVEYGNYEAVRELLAKGWSVNVKEPYKGNTPLHIAAKTKNSKLVQLLVNDYHAMFNVKNKDGALPLKYALDNYDVDSTRIIVLKAAGEIDNCRGAGGITTLHLAAAKCDVDLIFHLLKNSRVDVNVKDLDGHTPLHLAAIRNVGCSHFHTIEVLLNRKADPNAINSFGKTPFDYLVRDKHSASVVKLFLEYGVKVVDEVQTFEEEPDGFEKTSNKEYESIVEILKEVEGSVKTLKEEVEKLKGELNVMKEQFEDYNEKIKSLTRYLYNETHITHLLLFVLVIYFLFFY